MGRRASQYPWKGMEVENLNQTHWQPLPEPPQ